MPSVMHLAVLEALSETMDDSPMVTTAACVAFLEALEARGYMVLREESYREAERAASVAHTDQHGREGKCSGCWDDIPAHMAVCGCPERPRCHLHPADHAHQWRSICYQPHGHDSPAPDVPALLRIAEAAVQALDNAMVRDTSRPL